MAWRRTGNKPLSEPMMTQFNDAYMCHTASMVKAHPEATTIWRPFYKHGLTLMPAWISNYMPNKM